VLYLVFDRLAAAALHVLTRWFGFRPEPLVWLVGRERGEEAEEVGFVSRPPDADVPAGLPEQAHV
jgi:hypothetical protein